MGYDSRAVRVKKAEKALALLCYNKERERHLIREFAAAEAKNTRARPARNRGDKDAE
jgi:hypothetical protein